jgi:hypothetical protein
MTDAENSNFEEENKPVTSPTSSGRTFWFNDEGGAPIHEAKGWSARDRFHSIFTSPHLYYLIVIFLILGLNLGQIVGQRPLHTHLPPVPSPDLEPLCGSSPEEALALGCVFDVYVK